MIGDKTERGVKMKLNPNFIKHTMDGMALVVPVAGADFHGIVQGNKTVDDILSCLEKDMSETEIVDFLCEKYDGDRSVIEEDVADVVSRLKEIGAVDE